MAVVLGYSWHARTWAGSLRSLYVCAGVIFALWLVRAPVGGRRLDRRDWGLGSNGLVVHALALLLPSVAFTFTCAALSPEPDETVAALLLRAVTYTPWALVQNLFVLGLLRSRMLLWLGNERSTALATGLVFGCLHMPNPYLTVATTMLGFLFAWLFSLRRCVLVIALAHALLGAAADDILDWNLRVGVSYNGQPMK